MQMNYAVWIKWALLIGLSLVFFVPFLVADGGGLVPNMFFPFITGKNFVFRIVVELLFALYVLLALKEPKYRPTGSLLLWVFGAFVLWMAVATTVSADPIKSFWSNFERMEGYITVLHLFLYFTMVGAVISAANWWKRFFQVSVAAASLEALYALGQLLHIGGLAPSSQSDARLDGTFGNAAYLGIFMLFNTFITLYLLVRDRRSMVAQSIYGVALVLEVAVLYYTQTRSAFLGLLVGLVVCALYVVWGTRQGGQWKSLRRMSMYALGAVVLVVVVFVSVRNTSFVRQNQTLARFASISLTDSGSQARFQIWDMAWQGFKQSPKTIAVGWGQENFSFVFNKYYSPGMYAQEQWFDRAHNQFLDWLIAGGLPAFLLYVSLFVLAALAILRSELEVPEQAVFLGLLAGYAFNNLFVFDDLMSSLYFFAILAYLHSLSKRGLPRFLFLSRPMSERGLAVVAPIFVALVLVGVWALNAPGIARARNLVEAITPAVLVNGTAQPKDQKLNLAEFKVALGSSWPGTPLGQQEVTEQLFQFSSSVASSQSADPSLKQQFADLAASSAQTVLAQRPHDARLELFYGSVLESFGQLPQALTYIQSALADSPYKQQIMFEKGLVYLNGRDFPDALASFKQAFDEAPGYRDARIMYATAFYYAGDIKSGDALLLAGPASDGFGTVLVDDSRILQAYTNTKQFDRIIGIWKNRVAASPTDAQTSVGLAAAYFSASDIQDTIAQLQHTEQIDPAHAAQIEAIIGKIKDGSLKPGQ